MVDLWQIERELRGVYPVIAGVDEAGRGPLAGPVVAAAVILPSWEPALERTGGLEGPGAHCAPLRGLDDSKKLSEVQREVLFDEICAVAIAYGIGLATEAEIDEINILNATYLAMNRAIGALGTGTDLCLIDGNRADGLNYVNQCVVKGDSQCACIAAASILAKVHRDRLMMELDGQYPLYGFGKHKGYPTKAHYAALDEYGPSVVHRRSFLKKWEKNR
ncbi:MAG: ribonuclease HII [Oscillospiraceae bacterium]|nr:ribonuclease HII [Oscillospiraceae bacterium]